LIAQQRLSNMQYSVAFVQPSVDLPPGPRGVRLEPVGAVRLFDADPDLAACLSEDARTFARRYVRAEVGMLDPGRWVPSDDVPVTGGCFGLLVLEGSIVRAIAVGGRRSVELLGAGDLVRPGQDEPDVYATVGPTAEWRVLTRTRVAILDDDLISGVAGLPGVLCELAGRGIQRTRALALRLAIASAPNLEQRLWLLLWHLADRWGRRERDAVVVDLKLSQGLLGDLIGARRTSINAALRRLQDAGSVSARPDGRWALHGEAPNLEAQLDYAAA
jgi:CRP/FNR family transcriptional regulator, cyclic AMP receptor protein